jgi:hypothetical protein
MERGKTSSDPERKDEPEVADGNIGTGGLTYVDLSLRRQLRNAQADAFRLLANLVS